MKENYKMIIEYEVCDFNGRIFMNSNRFSNLREFWSFIERYYSDAISIEIHSIEMEW